MPVEKRRANTTHAGLTLSCNASATPDQWFVGIAISGGGSRSAAFASAAMFELQRLGLLQRVDAISAVSGGTLPAAFYCVSSDQEWTEANMQRRLSYPIATDMWWRVLAPWNGPAMLFSDYDRSDILAEVLDQVLFRRGGRSLTYGDLRPDRPRLLLNATDLQSGRRFVFCNESFDELNSDLSRYPLAYATAASSSVPIVLHHVTLRDYSTIFKQYRHFVDGGVVDNLGVQTLMEAYNRANEEAEKKGRPLPYSKGSVIIVLDAGTQFDAQLSNRGDFGFIESLGVGAKLTSGMLIQRASSATLVDLIVRHASPQATAQTLRDHVEKLERNGFLQTTDAQGRPMTVFHIAISRAVGLKNAPHSSFAQRLESVPTYFNITDIDAYNLHQAAKLIIRERFEAELEQALKTVKEK